MTTNLAEVHIYYGGWLGGWEIRVLSSGYPPPDVPISTEVRFWKKNAVQYGRDKQRSLWENNHVASELFVHDRMGRIQDRSTYPHGADPIRSLG